MIKAPISAKVFRPPQHIHVQVWCYEGWDGRTSTGKTCDVWVIANDEVWAEQEGIRRSGLPEGHRTQITQCSDPQHLEGLELTSAGTN